MLQKNFKHISAVMLLIVIGCVCYWNSFDVPFQFDDLPYITKNLNIRDITNIPAIWNSLSHPSRFITFYTFAVNYHFGAYDVFGYHVLNLLIHVVCGILIFIYLRQLLLTPRMKSADIIQYKLLFPFTVAALFLAHPVQTQAVTYIVQRFASLATLFYLLTHVSYVQARLTGNNGYYCLTIASMLLGMFTKQITFTLPITLILVEYCFFSYAFRLHDFIHRYKYQLLIGFLFLFIIPAIFGFNVDKVLGMQVSSGNYEGDVITSRKYFLTQLRVIPTYLKLLLWPSKQSLDYQFPLSQSLFELKTMSGFVFLTALFIFGIYQLRKHVLVGFGILWFFITLSVESSIIPIHHVIYEHRCYLPSFGFFLVAAYVLIIIIKKIPIKVCTIVILITLLSVLTIKRNMVWQDKIALWQDALQTAPGQFKVHDNLGYEYWQAEDFAKALTHFNRAIEINPGYPTVYNNRGGMYFDQGMRDLAIEDFEYALRLNPRYADALYNLGKVYYEEKDLERALTYYTQAIAANRRYAEAYNNRGNIYGELERFEEALNDFNQALKYDDRQAHTYYHRAFTLKKLGDVDAAIKDYSKAIALNPEYAEAYNNRGNIYKERDMLAEALFDYTQAVKYDNELGKAYYSQAMIYKERMDLDQAYAGFSRFIELNPENCGNALFQRSLILSAMKRNQEAMADARRAEDMGYPIDQGYLAYLKGQL